MLICAFLWQKSPLGAFFSHLKHSVLPSVLLFNSLSRVDCCCLKLKRYEGNFQPVAARKHVIMEENPHWDDALGEREWRGDRKNSIIGEKPGQKPAGFRNVRARNSLSFQTQPNWKHNYGTLYISEYWMHFWSSHCKKDWVELENNW